MFVAIPVVEVPNVTTPVPLSIQGFQRLNLFGGRLVMGA